MMTPILSLPALRAAFSACTTRKVIPERGGVVRLAGVALSSLPTFVSVSSESPPTSSTTRRLDVERGLQPGIQFVSSATWRNALRSQHGGHGDC